MLRSLLTFDQLAALDLARRNAGVLAVIAWTRARLRWLIAIVIAFVLVADLLNARGASVADGSRIAVVAVDADQDLTTGRFDILDSHRPSFAIALTVATGAVEFTKIKGDEAIDGNRRGGVVLDDSEVMSIRALAQSDG